MGNTYTEGKLVMSKETNEITSSIEMVIKALGTMVLVPEYETNPNEIGVKKYTGNIQQPILLGEARDKALSKLSELIAEL